MIMLRKLDAIETSWLLSLTAPSRINRGEEDKTQSYLPWPLTSNQTLAA